MDNLLFALGTVLPVFLMAGAGFLLRKRGALTREFCDTAASFNFRYCFPAMVFDSLYTASFKTLFSVRLMLCALGGVIIMLAVAWTVSILAFPSGKSPAGVSDVGRRQALRGAFIQGTFRGNIVLLGLPMAIQVFGESMRAEAAIVTAIIVTAYNLLSVPVLAIHGRRGGKAPVSSIVKTIVTNPMILGLAAALPFAITGTGIPKPFSVFIKYFGSMTVPLALLDIGAGMVGRGRPANPGRVLLASILKTALTPIVYGAIFFFGGMPGRNVALMVLLGATPTAMVSFPMAKLMGCDGELAGDIVLVSTLLSAFTMACAILVLRFWGMA